MSVWRSTPYATEITCKPLQGVCHWGRFALAARASSELHCRGRLRQGPPAEVHLLRLHASDQSIKAPLSVLQLGNKAASMLPGALQLPAGSALSTPSVSVQSTPTGSVTFTASRRGSRSRFVAAGSRTGSQSEAADLKDASTSLSRRISMFNAGGCLSLLHGQGGMPLPSTC